MSYLGVGAPWGVLGALGVLGLLQPSSVFSVILRGCGLVFPHGGFLPSSLALELKGVEPGSDPNREAGELPSDIVMRGTGDAVLPADIFLPFFLGTKPGVQSSSCGRSFSGVPSSPGENVIKEQYPSVEEMAKMEPSLDLENKQKRDVREILRQEARKVRENPDGETGQTE